LIRFCFNRWVNNLSPVFAYLGSLYNLAGWDLLHLHHLGELLLLQILQLVVLGERLLVVRVVQALG
jgi:hypothetical protein